MEKSMAKIDDTKINEPKIEEVGTTAKNAEEVEEATPNLESRSTSGGSIFDDIDKLRRRQDFDALVGTQRVLVSVPVGKPGKQTWFRVLPGEEWQLPAALLKLEEDGTYFYVTYDIYPDLEAEAIRVVLRTVVTTQGTISLWPIRLPNPDGRDFPWWISARAVAVQAETAWVRMRANQEVGAYDVIKATDNYGEPDLPQRNFSELLEVAFAGKVIESLDHPVVLKLLGRPQ
jgi:hypothetical protein